MIIIHTDYDPISNALSRYAQALIAEEAAAVSAELGPLHSQAATIQNHLAVVDTKSAVYFFGHGTDHPPTKIGQDQIPAIYGAVIGLLQSRLVYGACCYSVSGIGALAVAQGTTTIGFSGVLYVPYVAPTTSRWRDPFLLRRELRSGSDANQAHQMAVQEFQQLANGLQASAVMTDQIVSVLMSFNATSCNLVGSGTRTLP